jgi:hypothetical protein
MYCILVFNPNPHGFKAITNVTASEPLLPHPLHSTVGGRGEGAAVSSAALRIFLVKTQVTLKFSSKAH